MKTIILIMFLALTNVSMAGGNIKTIANSSTVRLENKMRIKLGSSKSLADNRLEGKKHGSTDLRSLHNKAFKKGK